MGMGRWLHGAGALPAILVATEAAALTFTPDPVFRPGLTVKIEEAALPFAPSGPSQYASPVVIDGALHVVDQFGEIRRQAADGSFETVFTAADLPPGIVPAGGRAILNIADGPGGAVVMAITSDTLPPGIGPAAALPTAPEYGSGQRDYQVIYRFAQGADGRLRNPQALAAFEMPPRGHAGGGLLALDTGEVLFATGDALGFDRDGLAAPQDVASHLGKLLLIDDGGVEVVAQGVRNVQRLTFTDEGKSRIAFADIGANTAEEINSIALSDLLDDDPQTTPNFGWGRNPDGRAREGTFYITVNADGRLDGGTTHAPQPEPGFLQPYAQLGREGEPFIAISGPAVSPDAFDSITSIFGDLVSGSLYATLDPFGGSGLADVYAVTLVDPDGALVTLKDLAAGRPDPRFFSFADGGAGVLLEATGRIYRLSDATNVIPLPAGAWMLLTGLAGLWMAPRRSGAGPRS
ncbi:MAG: hypothetical protein AAF763_10545 [Pseudomonadota bacterium]